MIEAIKHGFNLLRHTFRDVGLSAKRSTRWPTVEKHFLENNSTCAACGSKKNLNVHHCIPFHLDPALELDPTNLITLCMGRKECHLRIGHGGSFKQYCLEVRKYAATVLAHPEKFDEIVQEALTHRKAN
jgi:5-methylcytosine-specific restriction protein A